MCKYHTYFAIILASLFGFSIQTAYAAQLSDSSSNATTNQSTLKHWLQQTKLSGNLRSYYFSRDFSNPLIPMQNSFSLGGGLNVQSAPIWQGFSVGGSYYAADPLGLNSDIFDHLDPTLPGQSVNVLGQAYAQYQNDFWLFRAGKQLIATPWLNDADTRMIPATYEGVVASLTPNSNLTFTAFRQYRFKSRTSKSFDLTNLYDDPNDFATSIPALNGLATIGTLAAGGNYVSQKIELAIWRYEFYDYGNLSYIDGKYFYQTASCLYPFIGAQWAAESPNGKEVINAVGLGKTHARIYGLIIGAEAPEGQIAFGFDDIPKHSGAYLQGDVVSPYTSGYASDPLYTTSMTGGLIEKSAGYAFKLSGTYWLFDKQLQLYASYAKFYTAPLFPNTHEPDFDVIYHFTTTMLKGLSIRYRLGLQYDNPRFSRLMYNRLMIQYAFG